MNNLRQIANDVERKFSEPNYLEHKIRYIPDRENADIIVSTRHTFGDYLLIGIVGLLHSIQGKEGDILVFNDPSPDMDTIGVAIGRHTMRSANVSSLFMQANKPVEEIYKSLYKGTLSIAGVGLNMSLSMMLEFSDIGNGIPKEIMSELEFHHFDDLKTAEKDAFVLIKKMASAAIAGTYYAFGD